jgi:glycosyltransferase involved in cell wall biosynthesis
VLARSVRRQHPDVRIDVVVIDADPDRDTRTDQPFHLLTLADIGLDNHLGRRMAGIYDVTEMATAVKAWALDHLVRTSSDPVIYLDPDIQVFAPLDPLAAAALDGGIAVTPHVLVPVPRDGKVVTEATLLAVGMFNLGFIAVGPGAVDSGFLAFWQERLRLDAVRDPERMLFTDQRWADFLYLFPHVVIDDPGCNVAWWNLWGRRMSRIGGEILVDGRPLRFFHFSGFDPDRPSLLSTMAPGRPRVLLSEQPLVAELCRDYADALAAEEAKEDGAAPYGWSSTELGLELVPHIRRAYRDGLLDAGRSAGPAGDDHAAYGLVPGPFDDDGGAAFARWLTTPAGPTDVPRCLTALAAMHVDLVSAFPDPVNRPRTARALRAWAETAVDDRAELVRTFLGWEKAGAGQVVPQVPDRPGPGVTVIGYLDAEDGVGQAARLVRDAASVAAVPHSVHVSRMTPSSRAHQLGRDPGTPFEWDTNLFCINADSLQDAIDLLPDWAVRDRASVALWAWETDALPERFHASFDLVDEVWAMSRFIEECLIRVGRGVVRRFPIPVPVPTWTTSLTRADLGLPEGFLVLFMFSWRSIGQRKNPQAVVEAFRRAFDPSDGAQLVLKSIGGDDHIEELEALRLDIDRPDIHVIDGPRRAGHVRAMLDHCDCYLSLHRSEGFGLTMAEAMARGKPVVATGWSGNLEFMDEQTAHLVPATVVPVPADVPIYGGSGNWAEPDLDAAAAAIRRVFDDPAGAAALGRRARTHIERTLSPMESGRALARAAERLRHRQRAS